MNLYCEECSALTKQDTLFIHGNLASTRWWGPTLAAWRKLGSRGPSSMLFADWRGCGQNADWDGGLEFSLKDLASDFLELLERRGNDPVALVGHSLGGLIALQMMILAPERFSRAVLLDPVGANGVVFDDSMYEAFRQMAASRDLTRTVILSTVRGEKTLDAEFKEHLVDDAFKAVKGIGSSVLEILKSVRLEAEARRVRIPTLILHGAHDQIIPLADSKALAANMSEAKLEVLPEAGHCWNIENPEAWVLRLRQWL